MSLRDEFLNFDDRLGKHGVPLLTEWWRTEIGRYLDAYEAGDTLEFLACAGRGSAKSTALYKLAMFFTLFGSFTVPVGERHYAVVLSRLVAEASKGITIIASWLRLLGIAHHVAGDVVELDDMPRGIRVVAASVAAASGWRAYFVGRDERSKWPMGGAIEERDAEEIDSSAVAMTATHPNAPIVSFGSAWGAFGSFYDSIMSGTDANKVVAGPAATWVAAPHVSEESTRKKERDPRRWAREYACQFQAGAASAFDQDLVERAFVNEVPEDYSTCARIILVDPCAGSSDTYAYCAMSWRVAPEFARWMTVRKWSKSAREWFEEPINDEHGNRIPNPDWVPQAASKLEMVWLGGIDNAAAKGWTSDAMVDGIVRAAREHGAIAVHGDQFERYALQSAVNARGLPYFPHVWTAPLKERCVERVRQWLRDGVLVFPKSERLKRELLTFEERIAPSGALTFRGRKGGHDDFAMLVMLAALVDVEGGFPGSPIASATPGYRRPIHIAPEWQSAFDPANRPSELREPEPDERPTLSQFADAVQSAREPPAGSWWDSFEREGRRRASLGGSPSVSFSGKV